MTKNKVMRFMRFVNEHQPFRETRGRAARSQGGERRNQTPPKIVPQKVLEAFLDGIRATGDAEYLLAWLVYRMGLMARPAYDLTLDRVRINDWVGTGDSSRAGLGVRASPHRIAI